MPVPVLPAHEARHDPGVRIQPGGHEPGVPRVRARARVTVKIRVRLRVIDHRVTLAAVARVSHLASAVRKSSSCSRPPLMNLVLSLSVQHAYLGLGLRLGC